MNTKTPDKFEIFMFGNSLDLDYSFHNLRCNIEVDTKNLRRYVGPFVLITTKDPM